VVCVVNLPRDPVSNIPGCPFGSAGGNQHQLVYYSVQSDIDTMEAITDSGSIDAARPRDTFGPPTRVSTTTSGSAQSSDADTRGAGGRFQTKYTPGSRITFDQEDLDGNEHKYSQDCFIELVSDTNNARFE